jgi:hypothetical protein
VIRDETQDADVRVGYARAADAALERWAPGIVSRTRAG